MSLWNRTAPFGGRKPSAFRRSAIAANVSPVGTEFPDTGHQPVEIGGLLVPPDRAGHLVTGLLTARPGDRHPDPVADAFDGHLDPLDQEPDDPLAVGRCGRRGVPQRRQVTGQLADLVHLVAGQRGRLRLPEAGVFLLQPPDLLQRLLPPPLQRPLDQPVLRFGRLILPLDPGRLGAGPLQPLSPVLVQRRPLPHHIVGRGQAQLQGPGLQGGQHLVRDELIEDPAGQRMATRAAGIGHPGPAGVAEDLGPAGVVDGHPLPTPAADDQPGQQRGPSLGAPLDSIRARFSASRRWLASYGPG